MLILFQTRKHNSKSNLIALAQSIHSVPSLLDEYKEYLIPCMDDEDDPYKIEVRLYEPDCLSIYGGNYRLVERHTWNREQKMFSRDLLIQIVVDPGQPSLASIRNVPLTLGNNFTMEHLIEDLANIPDFWNALHEVQEQSDIKEVEIISTERKLMPNLTREVKEVFVLDELVNMLETRC